MHPHQPRTLHHKFHIPRHPIPPIQRPILPRLIIHLQQVKHPPLIHPRHFLSKLRQPFIRLVPGLVDYIGIEVGFLVVEEGGGEFPEFVRGESEDGEAGFMGEGGGGVPGLDLVAEDELEGFGGVGFGEGGEDGCC